MCGRFTITDEHEDIEKRFDALLPVRPRHHPRYNVAPTQAIPVLTQDSPSKFTWMRWGLRPAWWTYGSRDLINIRADSLTSKYVFKKLLTGHRCLIPADGFFEWKKTSKAKIPYHITRKDHDLFAFACVWEEDTDPKTGKLIPMVSIITTTPNSLMKPIHDRMPVILKQTDEQKWLDPTLPSDRLVKLLVPSLAKDLSAVAISTLVNSPANDTPDVLRPLA